MNDSPPSALDSPRPLDWQNGVAQFLNCATHMGPPLDPVFHVAKLSELRNTSPAAEGQRGQSARPKKRRGRRPKIDDTAKAQIIALVSLGLSRRQTAARIGCHAATLGRIAKRDRRFAADLRRAEQAAETPPLRAVVGANGRGWRSAAHWLDRPRRA